MEQDRRGRTKDTHPTEPPPAPTQSGSGAYNVSFNCPTMLQGWHYSSLRFLQKKGFYLIHPGVIHLGVQSEAGAELELIRGTEELLLNECAPVLTSCRG